ncbi:hypothetical protein BC830DRAFT_1164339 [Chytriomyces sp. MP71]|nr:hypothetical protein BC830DRAFT_1164339 [Chytriomyces sp. MP71]
MGGGGPGHAKRPMKSAREKPKSANECSAPITAQLCHQNRQQKRDQTLFGSLPHTQHLIRHTRTPSDRMADLNWCRCGKATRGSLDLFCSVQCRASDAAPPFDPLPVSPASSVSVPDSPSASNHGGSKRFAGWIPALVLPTSLDDCYMALAFNNRGRKY